MPASYGTFQCVIRNIERQNIFVGADIIVTVHDTSIHGVQPLKRFANKASGYSSLAAERRDVFTETEPLPI